MAVVELNVLTPDNAEKVIACIWQTLEKHGIASPRIETRRDGPNRIAVRVTFKTQRDGDAVSAALRRLVVGGRPGTDSEA